jgi:indole-3-glycerol phosphate synthase
MHPERLVAEKRAEARRLAGLSSAEATPSRRDFTQFVATQKSGVALIPRLARAAPEVCAAWPGLDIGTLARVWDQTEIGAIAVRTASFYDGRLEDLQVVAGCVTAPVLHDELCLHPKQVYQSRLAGADAVVLPAALLDRDDLETLLGIASSLHMAGVIEVCEEREIEVAAALPQACIGLSCPSEIGFADLGRARALAEAVDRRRTVLLLSEVPSLDCLGALDGLIDAGVVGKALLDASDPLALLAGFLEGRA